MSSRPMLQAIAKKIDEMGGEDWVFDMITDGTPLKKVAELVGCSRPYLYNWRDMAPHKERRREKWAEAMKLSAQAQAEDGGEILEDLARSDVLMTPADVSLAKARSEYRQWLASVRDKESFGKGNDGVHVNLNIQNLHLDALRQVSLAGSSVQGQIQEAEVLAIEEGSDADS